MMVVEGYIIEVSLIIPIASMTVAILDFSCVTYVHANDRMRKLIKTVVRNQVYQAAQILHGV